MCVRNLATDSIWCGGSGVLRFWGVPVSRERTGDGTQNVPECLELQHRTAGVQIKQAKTGQFWRTLKEIRRRACRPSPRADGPESPRME